MASSVIRPLDFSESGLRQAALDPDEVVVAGLAGFLSPFPDGVGFGCKSTAAVSRAHIPKA